MIKFGPSGNSEKYHEFYSDSSHSAKWVKEMGLDCFEYPFGRGVNLSIAKAKQIGEWFQDEGIEISVHAPYFINFAGLDEDKLHNSYRYILESLEAGKEMGAKRCVFHSATQGKLQRDEAIKLTYDRLCELSVKVKENGFDDMIICPETMGKIAQIGTTEEICNFCNIAPFFYPCVDFGHINAREHGSLKTKEDFLYNLDLINKICGREKLDGMHIHFSKIMYSGGGEVKHLTFEDNVYGPEFEPLALALKERDVNPYIICESAGTQDIDAKYMKDVYFG